MTSRPCQAGIYVNPGARTWRLDSKSDNRIRCFHQQLPGFAPTPLVSVDLIAKELGVRHVFVKDESSRATLLAFKILGASWVTYRAIAQAVGSPLGVPLEDISTAARKNGNKLFAATDGNHGRAVARMAKIIGLQCTIYVPAYLDQATKDLIAGEGAQVVVVDGDYDSTVKQAKIKSEVPQGLLIQDTAFEGYTEIAQWIVDGYSTMMVETEEQVLETTGSALDFVVVPVGVGSLAQSAVSYWKSKPYPCTVLMVEPDSAACLKSSLISGAPTSVPTGDTIMTGLNCGTVSSIAWPILQKGVDVSISISDSEADEDGKRLRSLGIDAGPCAAATYAALKTFARESRELGDYLRPESIVILFRTEGSG